MRFSFFVVLLLGSPLADARRLHKDVNRHSGTSDVATVATTPAPGSGDTTEAIVSTLLFLVKKFSHGLTVYSKFNTVMMGVDETKAAISLAEDAAKELANKIPVSIQLLAKSGFYELLKKLNEGTVELADFELLDEADQDKGSQSAAKMKEALEECNALAGELKTILTTFDGIVAFLDGTKELINATDLLTDEVIPVSLSDIVDPVRNQLRKGREAVNKLYEQLDGGASKVMPMIDALMDGGSSEAMSAYEKIQEKYPTLFAQMEAMMPELELLYESVIKPLLPRLQKAVKAVGDYAEKLWPRIERPDSVATETIARGSCSWKTTRRFKSIEDVDVDTMSCKADKSWHGRYSCQCMGKHDCYVKSANRPEPTNVRRCFKVQARGHA